MVNNVGRTTKQLNVNLGGTTSFTQQDTVTIIAGELGRGLLLFDDIGTLGVISSGVNNGSFSVTTCALSVDLDLILHLDY